MAAKEIIRALGFVAVGVIVSVAIDKLPMPSAQADALTMVLLLFGVIVFYLFPKKGSFKNLIGAKIAFIGVQIPAVAFLYYLVAQRTIPVTNELHGLYWMFIAGCIVIYDFLVFWTIGKIAGIWYKVKSGRRKEM
jgi:hypothetical protein